MQRVDLVPIRDAGLLWGKRNDSFHERGRARAVRDETARIQRDLISGDRGNRVGAVVGTGTRNGNRLPDHEPTRQPVPTGIVANDPIRITERALRKSHAPREATQQSNLIRIDDRNLVRRVEHQRADVATLIRHEATIRETVSGHHNVVGAGVVHRLAARIELDRPDQIPVLVGDLHGIRIHARARELRRQAGVVRHQLIGREIRTGNLDRLAVRPHGSGVEQLQSGIGAERAGWVRKWDQRLSVTRRELDLRRRQHADVVHRIGIERGIRCRGVRDVLDGIAILEVVGEPEVDRIRAERIDRSADELIAEREVVRSRGDDVVLAKHELRGAAAGVRDELPTVERSNGRVVPRPIAIVLVND